MSLYSVFEVKNQFSSIVVASLLFFMKMKYTTNKAINIKYIMAKVIEYAIIIPVKSISSQVYFV